MENYEKIFYDYLKNNDLKYTKERKEILDAVFSLEGHFDVDNLYEYFKKNNSNMSMATIYRTLPLLEKSNIIRKTVSSFTNKEVYEHNCEKEKHIHLICRKCKKIIEKPYLNLKENIHKLAEEEKFSSIDSKVEIYGICEDCKIRGESMKIKEMKIGQKAKIKAYLTKDKIYREKLLRMGLVKGAIIELKRIAPMGDPIEILINNFSLSLRKDEAEILELEVLKDE